MMPHLPALILVLLAAAGGLAACSQSIPPDTFPGQPVTERNRIFKQMLRAFEPMGLMLRGKQTFVAADFQRHAEELKQLSTAPWTLFPPGSDYAPTKAKASIWERPAEFKQAQDEFISAAGKLAQAASSDAEETRRTAYEEVHRNCSSCHKAFRR